jgi:uncharacterized protein (DUF433 family)
MNLLIEPEAPPLKQWEDGSIRVAGTRLLLEMIVISYKQGDSPEKIVDSFPAASLKDVYAVIAYYLRHTPEVEAYLAWVEQEGDRIQKENEARFPRDPNLKARLLERRSKMEAERHADALR